MVKPVPGDVVSNHTSSNPSNVGIFTPGLSMSNAAVAKVTTLVIVGSSVGGTVSGSAPEKLRICPLSGEVSNGGRLLSYRYHSVTNKLLITKRKCDVAKEKRAWNNQTLN